MTAGPPIEIKPCPYVNGFSADNAGVDFMLKKYERYSDFVLFDDGKPARCFRFAHTTPDSSRADQLHTPPAFDPNKHCHALPVLDWLDDPDRKLAFFAFTEGLERQIAYRFEGAISGTALIDKLEQANKNIYTFHGAEGVNGFAEALAIVREHFGSASAIDDETLASNDQTAGDSPAAPASLPEQQSSDVVQSVMTAILRHIGISRGLSGLTFTGIEEAAKAAIASMGESVRSADVTNKVGVAHPASEWNPDAVLARLKPEGKRSKLEEWEAAYAMLFNQLNPVMEENARLNVVIAAMGNGRKSLIPPSPASETDHEGRPMTYWGGIVAGRMSDEIMRFEQRLGDVVGAIVSWSKSDKAVKGLPEECYLTADGITDLCAALGAKSAAELELHRVAAMEDAAIRKDEEAGSTAAPRSSPARPQALPWEEQHPELRGPKPIQSSEIPVVKAINECCKLLKEEAIKYGYESHLKGIVETLFLVIEPWIPHLRTTEPVSIEEAAKGLLEHESSKKWQMYEAKAFIYWPEKKAQAQAVLNAIGVAYE